MGTRSITTVRSRWTGEDDYKTHAVIYRHWDGYLSEQGCELFEFLDGLPVVNGFGSDTPKRHANGPGRLAAMLVVFMEQKDCKPDLLPDTGPCGQEFHYQVDVDFGSEGGALAITVFSGPMTAFGGGGECCNKSIFNGTVKEFGEFLAKDAATT